MVQQVNLCTASFQPVRQKFGAHSLVLGMVVFLVAGGVASSLWFWSMERSSQLMRQNTAAQVTEIASLKAAIAQSRARAGPVDATLVSQLQERRNAVQQREALIAVVAQGMFKPGQGHSDRLLMLSQSIPALVWVTQVQVDEGRFEVAGQTLEPAALNDWVASLATYPLMQGLKLSGVSVENMTQRGNDALGRAMAQLVPEASGGASAPAAPAAPARPMWSFKLVNLQPAPATPTPVKAAAAKP